ncbi:protein MAIN-LIKE 1-like [Arachis stenosperma]|uniref:protein MAIN-LIKE 1-like n=1 Tax=Arachis stenosperma TaxID=217475 RepID=UPI0025AD3CD4|nr:protein MAIN-LIKE 1-like [Arachis stenosperma]
MTITLQDMAYQLRLKINDYYPVSGCIGGWEQHHQGRTIEELCEQILGVVFGPEDRQSQTKWTVKLTWFHNMVCGELEQDATVERLMRYTRGYIMQLIGGIIFPVAFDFRVHIRWLPLLEDLDTCGRLSWSSAVLEWLWVQYQPNNVTGESRLRHYRRTLNGIGMQNELPLTLQP